MSVKTTVRPTLREMRPLIAPRPTAAGPRDPTLSARAGALAGREGALADREGSLANRGSSLSDREGYATDFLEGFDVPLPTPVGERIDEVTPIPGRDDGRLDYTHFSIVMSRPRRLAIFTALNLDGRSLVSVPRSDNWRLDPRLDASLQAGPDVYSRNPLDRGHLVRRTSANWGEDAERAEADTFHFTNCAPQMAAFNQQTWLGLEDYLLEHARADRQRLCIFTGPVFRESDRTYRGIRIPEAYWKVVAFTGEDGRPSATAYMIEQADELEDLGPGFLFGQYKTYQKSVARIEQLAQLDFGELSRFDGFSNEERDTGTRIQAEIRGPEDIRV
ncbi:DNA/RNA non-specific endonuclease [Salinicola halophilus]|uniref:DNA/RNA non-specific endonuclease n=1 Tax=Salinicola halophilus TaxID=184065 RepID=UPI00195510E5|nr:DNA/RNA non-specific endonuclease [Salinicola halophilus]